ncbi:DUF202 domain-containing protein [Leekyejoonella antrihumi]|uniref:DUF202 domain-containing protein n=1 Tax=Leekyejoonella antrihumi TaxID=1660198 RepID=UPI0016461F43|nr:DUF202 domain-containing protein [Leekyejoonella antrihumi]
MQNERTALSWQRTALSLLVATAALARLAFERVGYAGLTCLVALPLTPFVFREARRRYSHRDTDTADPHARGGMAGLCLSVVIIVLCLTGLAIVLRWPPGRTSGPIHAARVAAG